MSDSTQLYEFLDQVLFGLDNRTSYDLNWVGKKPLDYVKGFPVQVVEKIDPARTKKNFESVIYDDIKDDWRNLLFHGDNKEILATLLENGWRDKIDLIYLDPPFDSNADYVRKVELRGIKQNQKIEGEGYTLGEQIQYTDIWANDNYLQFMYERLLLLKEFLSKRGSLVLHCDWHKNHHLRLLLDEVFGPDKFVNEVVWYHWTKFQMREMGSLARNHDTLLVYAREKGSNIFKPLTRPLDRPKKLKRIFWDKQAGKIQNIKDENGKVVYQTVTDEKIDDVWDIPHVGTKANERVDYPTQKPEELLDYLLRSFSDEDSIIMDCFVGSGTTCAVAQRLGRRWIGADINKGAIQKSSRRIQQIISQQMEGDGGLVHQKSLDSSKLSNYCYAFGTYKVNDYDLQILRTEAIQLVIDHVGIQRSKTDSFFDGTLGKNLTKIIDFDHPLTLLDLQLISDELKKRPAENRNVTLVCLGKETTVDPWIEDYNKKHPVNKLTLIELRTDQKYGKFLIHHPDTARIHIERRKNKAYIKVEAFISPSILERLKRNSVLIDTEIKDFRSMIDVLLIDTGYDGKSFNVQYSDIPEKKSDFIKGEYEITIPTKKTTVAIMIIDMLGEDIMITKEI